MIVGMRGVWRLRSKQFARVNMTKAAAPGAVAL